MPKQFQSGHEVLSHYVPGYESHRPSNVEYNHDRALSGQRLGTALLEELRTAVAKIVQGSADSEPTISDEHSSIPA